MPRARTKAQDGRCGEFEYEPPSRVDLHVAGKSVHGRPLTYAEFGHDPPQEGQAGNTTLVVAGIHGDEMQSVFIARRLLEMLASQPELFLVPDGRLAGARVIILPMANPDGAVAKRRRNARFVDLNRNFPSRNWVPTHKSDRHHGGTEPASEPETQALIDLIERARPDKIIAIHTIGGGGECNNFDGPAEQLAYAMSPINQYPVEPSIGYATPGSLGTWAGI
ncbi:MAG: succinylglutamate desuccinylase/aspartoacylase family protein, partial [Phycisphaerales bacterium]